MIKFQNLKIAITEENSLEDIVSEFEIKGYKKREAAHFGDELSSCVIAMHYGIITWCAGDLVDLLWPKHKKITMDQLKEMRND